MKNLEYQQRAVTELIDKTIRLLNAGGQRNKMVFEATTGAGKTVMACLMLAGLMDELHDRGDSRYQEVAFIWFAPRKLHIQSYEKLKEAFEETRTLRPVMFDELDQNEGIRPGEILFVNWESVNKESNVMVREGDCSLSLYEITDKTKDEFGVPIVAIIDEEHMFWSKTADKSWLSGNIWLVSFKISYLCLPLFYETRTTPSCHPSGCAYRQRVNVKT